ncbi:MAG TPA: VWA domain-containing protein [Pseudomonadales bacterium]
MIELIWPYALLLAPLPLLVRWLWPPRAHQQAALTVPDVAQFKPDEPGTGLQVGGRWPWRLIVLWLIWASLVLAAARPQWTGDPVTLPTTGRDLMLAVDISGSMGTEDMQLGNRLVNRLAVVKSVVGDFIERRRGDRVGLILFGTNAYLQAPLTFDLASVERLLTEAPVGIAGGKTAIGDAIGLAVKRLRQRPQGNRVLILLTDGANNVGEVAPDKAAELATVEGIRIYTVGVGSEAMPMPSIFGVFSSGVINPSADLDEETLQYIADITNGRYFRAENTEQLVEIYDLIDAMEPIEQEAETFRPIAALYYWPLGFAWLLASALMATDLGWRRV